MLPTVGARQRQLSHAEPLWRREASNARSFDPLFRWAAVRRERS